MEGNKTQDYGAIGWAVNHMRHGHRVRRAAWPAGQWIGYVPAGSAHVPGKFGDGFEVKPFLLLKTDTDLVPWVISHDDLLAGDWALVNATQPGEYSSTRPASAPTEPTEPPIQSQAQ
jgi:hypothetical protein